jgi:2-polyprenyl-6-methoxyphenol hydroxylase-like FAD-dependent oxidoreductase
MTTSAVDVLVVGAGPTGLAMAMELSRRGRSVRFIDKATEPVALSKAIAIHARTLEVLEDIGVADELVGAGHVLRGVTMYADGKVVVRASFDELDTRYPYILSVSQVETEAVLHRAVVREGGRLERGVELMGLEQRPDGVAVNLSGPNGSERVEARYVVGCDGAHSTVRKLVGLGFTGDTYDEKLLLADVKLAWSEPDDVITSFFAKDGLLACFPMGGGRYRLIAMAEDEDEGADTLSLADFERIMAQRAHVPAKLSDPGWLARFRIHCRQVEHYRKARVFLAGDAAHIHSPAGGQGMNTGIQDAHNLAWKLSLACTGRASAALLDSYGGERHAVGRAVLQSTDFATRIGTLRNPLARAVRTFATRFMGSFEFVQQRMARQVAELTVGYERSAIVGEWRAPLVDAIRPGGADADERPNLGTWRKFDAGPRPGTRAPDGHCVPSELGFSRRLATLLDGRRFTLLLFDGAASTEAGYDSLVAIADGVRARWGDLVEPVIVTPQRVRPARVPDEIAVYLDPEGDLEERYGASSECLYLIRPDGYIGFRSQPASLDPLVAHVERLTVS